MKSFLTPVFVGRREELRQLGATLAAVQAGAGRCVLVSGEAGIGKSRLLAEMRGRAAQMGFTPLAGRCFEQDRSFPYAPLIDMLRPFLAQGAVADRLDALGSLAAELVKLLPELAAHLPVSQSAAPLESEVEQRRLFEALTSLFLHQAQAGPVLLIVEDLHWSDQASLEFLLYLVRRMAEHPMLLLLSSRGADDQPGLVELLAGLDREPIAQEIRLDPLTRAEVAELLKAILGQPQPLSAEFVGTIYSLTEGNPFFAEEICTSLIASGDIYYASMGDAAAIGHSLNRLGNWLMNSGQPFEALDYHREALDVFERLDDRAGIAATLDLLAMTSNQCSDGAGDEWLFVPSHFSLPSAAQEEGDSIPV